MLESLIYNKFEARWVFLTNRCFASINNTNFFRTILWIYGAGGRKKYFISHFINVVLRDNYIYLFTYNKIYFKFCVLFSILLQSQIRGFIRGYRLYMRVKGLGFKLKSRKNGNVIFKIGFSHRIIFKPSKIVRVKVFPKKARAFRLFSYNLCELKDVSVFIKHFRQRNKYKYQGIFYFREHLKLLESKKRTR